MVMITKSHWLNFWKADVAPMNNNQMTAELLTISELFGGEAAYTVPVYQRNYAWRVEQIEQLINDVQDATSDNETGYFLGNLVVTKYDGTNEFEVIDGQQRLTTLYLLLTFLEGNGSVPFSGHKGKLHYQSRRKASTALRNLASEAPLRSESEDGGIHEAFNIIGQFFKPKNNIDRNKFADFLRTSVTVVRASLPPKTDLNRYFEIMNTRGEQLKQVDIVKARLMSQLPEGERACFAWIWDACADMDSYVQMSLTPKKIKLREKLFGDDWSWLKVESFDELLKESVSSMSSDLISNAPLSLRDALQKYAQPSAASLDEGSESERFRSTIEFPVFLLHVLRVVDRLNGEGEDEGQLDDKRLIKQFEKQLNSNEKTSSEQANWVRNFGFYLLKLRNLFDAFIIKRQYTSANDDDGDWSLQRLKKQESKGSSPSPGYINTLEDSDGLMLQSMLRITYTAPRTMHWMTNLLRLLASDDPTTISGNTTVQDCLREHARSKVKPFLVAPDMEQPTGFDISRIVFTYLDYLLWREEPKTPFVFSFRNSIEHFYPQHPHPDQEQPVEQVSSIHKFGNLALVSVSANSKFSNSLPLYKTGFKEIIQAQSLKLQRMAQVTREKGWGEAQMLEHHNEMVALLLQDMPHWVSASV